MKDLILGFPNQIKESVRIGKVQCLKTNNSEIKNVVFCGMGGSGIGGRIVSQWIEKEIKVPLILVQNYDVPEFVNSSTLVIGSSYSGNTEETISALTRSRAKGANIVGITSGGRLKEFCHENSYDFIIVPGGLPPRAALGYSLVQLLVVLEHYNLITNNVLQALAKSATFLGQKLEDIMLLAEKIASKINNTQVVIYAEAPYESIAIRGKQQLNENSKYLCRHHVIPEMNHNELLGWGSGNNKHSAIFLMTSDINERNKKRFELTAGIVGEKTDNITIVKAEAENRIEESMYFIYLFDWISYFLGTARGVDLIEIDNIDYLKSELAK